MKPSILRRPALVLTMVGMMACCWNQRALAQDTPRGVVSPEIAAAEQIGKAIALAADHVKPAVVSVYSARTVKLRQLPLSPAPFDEGLLRRFSGQPMMPSLPNMIEPRELRVPRRGMGSGLIIGKDGVVLTNNHVVSEVDEIKVQLADGRTYPAHVLATDKPSDVAVIRIENAPNDLPVAELGDSGSANVGDLVVAIGSPFGYSQTVTSGIISAKGRSGLGINTYEDFLQTDAAINPGNSGGPLVNIHGQVVGVNSAIAGGSGQFSGVGFAIPIDMIKQMLPTLIRGESVTRGVLGIAIQPLTDDLARQFGLASTKGVVVSDVFKDSGAQRAGIEIGDVIVKYRNHDIVDVPRLRNGVASTVPGTEVELVVVRGGKEQTVKATVDELPGEAVTAAAVPPPANDGDVFSRLGCRVETLTPALSEHLGVKKGTGVLLTGVRDDSPASLAGLKEGDVVLQANHQPVAGADDLRAQVSKAETPEGLLLLVRREDGNHFFVVKMKPRAA